MTRPFQARRDETGVVLIIVACCMVVLMGVIALAIDSSYGFVQNRRAQNASDFAAFAAAEELQGSYYCNGLSAPTGQQIVDIISQIVADNDPDAVGRWSASYLDPSGNPLAFTDNDGNAAKTFTATNFPTLPPNNSCGITVKANPSWTPFFAQIFGIDKLGGEASGSVTPKPTTGIPLSIVALNKSGPHEILGGGTGRFVVSGNIFLNTNVSAQPWSNTYPPPALAFEWDDAIDAKTNSDLYVYGTIDSNGGTYNGLPLWPLDTCFSSDIVGEGNPGGSPNPGYPAGGDIVDNPPTYQLQCDQNSGSVNIDYDAIYPGEPQIDDPLQDPGTPPNPLNTSTDIACPGSTLQTNPPITADQTGTTQLEPGEYTTPVEITGSAVFNDCPGGYTGIYRFDQGLWINPQAAGDTVKGINVVLATENPYPVGGNVPGAVNGSTFTANGSGNGAPCLPAGTMTSVASANGQPGGMAETSAPSNPCAGTNPATYGVIGYTDSPIKADPSETGTGNNFSAIIGGVPGTAVSLTGPTTGIYGSAGSPGLVLYQDPGTQANFGFDAESGDGADITINGVVYNASLSNYGANSPLDFWDGTGGGIPFYAGGTLQAGFGSGWAAAPGADPSQGTVTLTGTAIVDDFNTDGGTDITIIGEPYNIAGLSKLKLID